MEHESFTFDENGYLLPHDIVPTDWDTMLDVFGENQWRQDLLTDLQSFITKLRSILPVNHRLWIDGSFVSQQLNPGDIDVIVFVPHTYFSLISDPLKQLKNEWVGRIDCYFVETFPFDHRNYEISRSDELTWYHFLRTDRRKRPKGILELNVDYGNQR